MRTKVLCAAALAAGALTSMAQVYSANVVGYVNVTIAGGSQYTMIANPLDGTMGGTVAGGNNITNIFAGKAADGDQIFRWNVGNFDFDAVQPTYSAFTHLWSNPFDLKPGEGVWYINNNSDFTVTFVGQVTQGSWTYSGGVGGTPNKIAGGSSYNALGAPVPIGGSFTNAIAGMTPGDGDQIFPWNVAAFDWSATQPTYSSFTHQWSHSDFVIPPGIGFVYINNNNDMAWAVNYTVQ